jgi:hypothetical protein
MRRNHKLLLRKLNQLNFSDPVVNWFRSYLTLLRVKMVYT